jgi:hypothetical protein
MVAAGFTPAADHRRMARRRSEEIMSEMGKTAEGEARPAVLAMIVTDDDAECPHCARRGGLVEEIETVLLWNPGSLRVRNGLITELRQEEDRQSAGQHEGYQCRHCKGAVLLPEGIDVIYI